MADKRARRAAVLASQLFVGLTALGHYSAVLLLVLYPTAALTKYVAGIHLPLVAKDPRSTAPSAAPEMLAGRSLLLSLIFLAAISVFVRVVGA